MEKPKLVYTMYIRSTPKKTWTAISKPEFTRKYWAGMANLSDWKAGSPWQHVSEDNQTWVTGKVLECVPGKRLVLTWVDPENSKDRSRVAFEIEPLGDSVRLTVTHDRFKADSDMPVKVSAGWPRVLCSLKSFLETGKGLKIFGSD